MPSCLSRPAGSALALALLVAASAAPAQAQVVIRERVEVRPQVEALPVVLTAQIEAGDEWTFEVGGELKLRVGPIPERYGTPRTTSSTQCGAPSSATFTFTIHGAEGDRTVAVPVGPYASVTSSYATDVCPGNGDRFNATFGEAFLDVGRVEDDETVDVTYSVAGASESVGSRYFPAIDQSEYDYTEGDGLAQHIYASIVSSYNPYGGSTIGPVGAVFFPDSLESEVTFSEDVVSFGGASTLGVDREYRSSDLFTVRLTEGAEFGVIRVETSGGTVEGDAIANVRYSHLESGAVTFVADGDFPGPFGLDATVAVAIESTSRGYNNSYGAGPKARGSITARAIWYEAAADPNPVALDEWTVVTVESVDEAGPVDLDPDTPVTLYAYTVDDVVVTLENARTGETASDQLTAPLGDVVGGHVRVRTEAVPDDPPAARTAARGVVARGPAAWGVSRPTGRATMARDRARSVAHARLARRSGAQAQGRSLRFAASVAGGMTGSEATADSAVGQVAFSTAGEDDAYVLIDIATHNVPAVEDYAIYGWVDLTVQRSTPTVRFLRQNGGQIPTNGPGAYLMVSKVRPDWLLPTGDQSFSGTGFENNVPFDNTGMASVSTHYDPDTYRLEADGVPDSFVESDIRFRLSLNGRPIWERGREGRDPLTSVDYEATCQDQGDGTLTCRSKQFIRLVSNAEPSQGAFTRTGSDGVYDDQKSGLQTIQVGLLDRVQLTLIGVDEVDGAPIEVPLTRAPLALTVGATEGPDAVQEAALSWYTYVREDGRRLPSLPGLITRRMSEDWAQAAVRFREAAPPMDVSAADINNVVRISVRGGQTTQQGTVSGTVTINGTPTNFSVPYSAGFRAVQIATGVQNRLVEIAGNASGYFLDGKHPTQSNEIVIVAGWNGAVSLGSLQSSDPDVTFRPAQRDLLLENIGTPQGNQAGLAVAHALRDPDLTTVNVIVQPLGAVRSPTKNADLLANATGDNVSNRPNTLILNEYAADLSDGQSSVAGHEVGHVLLVGAFFGSNDQCGDLTGPASHISTNYNFMVCAVPAEGALKSNPHLFNPEWLGAPKRLTNGQQVSARCESGIPTDPSLCPAGEPSGPTRLLFPPSTLGSFRLSASAPSPQGAPALHQP